MSTPTTIQAEAATRDETTGSGSNSETETATTGPGAGEALEDSEPELAPVTVEVLNLDGQPIAGARVLHGGEAPTKAQRTRVSNAAGKAEIPGGTSIYVEADGFVNASPHLPAGQTTPSVYLIPASEIVGRVIHASTKKPVAGASVSVKGSELGVSDAGGNFRITGLRPGRIHLSIKGAGVLGTTFAAVGLGESRELELAVYPTTPVTGRVTVDNAVCSAGTVSLAIGVEGSSSICPICGGSDDTLSAPIASDGTFRIEVPPGLVYAPEVACDDTVTDSPGPIFVTDKGIEGLHWDVSRGRTIRGRVVDKDGRGMPEITVLLISENLHPENSTRGVETDKEGRFVARGLVEDTYSLEAGSSDPQDIYYEGEISVDLKKSDATEVVIDVVGTPWESYEDPPDSDEDEDEDEDEDDTPAKLVLRGKVVDVRGQPVVGSVVVAGMIRRREEALRLLPTAWVKQPVRSDANGEFSLAIQPPDPEYHGEKVPLLMAYGIGGGVGVWDVTLDKLDKPATIVLAPLGSIVGKVRDRRRQPVPHFGVDLARERARPEFLLSPDGSFEVPGLVAGPAYSVRIHTPLGGVGKRVMVQPGKQASVGTLKVAGAASSMGVSIEDLDGNELAGCPVQTGLLGRRPGPKQTTDNDGWVHLEDVPAGPTWITVGPCTVDGRRYPRQRRYTSVRSEPNAFQWIRVAAMTTEKPGSLGYTVAPIQDNLDPLAQSLQVTKVQPNSPASVAGLEVGDVITGVRGHSVAGRRSYLHDPLTTVAAGTSVELQLADGRKLRLQATGKPAQRSP